MHTMRVDAGDGKSLISFELRESVGAPYGRPRPEGDSAERHAIYKHLPMINPTKMAHLAVQGIDTYDVLRLY
jgi:hypothetical protein